MAKLLLCLSVPSLGGVRRGGNDGLDQPADLHEVHIDLDTLNTYCSYRQLKYVGKYITIFQDVLYTFIKVLSKF